jgi:hypothetical protein
MFPYEAADPRVLGYLFFTAVGQMVSGGRPADGDVVDVGNCGLGYLGRRGVEVL